LANPIGRLCCPRPLEDGPRPLWARERRQGARMELSKEVLEMWDRAEGIFPDPRRIGKMCVKCKRPLSLWRGNKCSAKGWVYCIRQTASAIEGQRKAIALHGNNGVEWMRNKAVSK